MPSSPESLGKFGHIMACVCEYVVHLFICIHMLICEDTATVAGIPRHHAAWLMTWLGGLGEKSPRLKALRGMARLRKPTAEGSRSAWVLQNLTSEHRDCLSGMY